MTLWKQLRSCFLNTLSSFICTTSIILKCVSGIASFYNKISVRILKEIPFVELKHNFATAFKTVMSLSRHHLPINCSVFFKHKYLLRFHSRQQFEIMVWKCYLYFFLIRIRITTELLKPLKENVSIYPHLGTHRVKEALGKVLTAFPPCSREGS